MADRNRMSRRGLFNVREKGRAACGVWDRDFAADALAPGRIGGPIGFEGLII